MNGSTIIKAKNNSNLNGDAARVRRSIILESIFIVGKIENLDNSDKL